MAELGVHARLVMLGCGSIGRAVLPLILRHLGASPDRIAIVTADARGRDEAAHYGIAFHEVPLTRENHRRVLEPMVGMGDFVLNLSVDVSSTAIARFCHELGVLLMGHAKGAFWYGSQLTIGRARQLAPYNSATSLQVAAGVLGGMVWAVEHPTAGIVEADELDHRRALEVARSYLGTVVGVYGDWTPLENRAVLFPEDVDPADPWQFKNVLVG
jgi:homospermidine synthase